MTISAYTITNASLRFLDGLEGRAAEGARFLDVVVSECRSIHPGSWSPLAYAAEVKADQFKIQLNRPSNAQQFRVDVHFEGQAGLEILAAWKDPLDVQTVRQHLKARSATFLGCARQCADRLDESLQKIASLGSLFGQFQVLVFENDSSDGTLAKLQEWATRIPLVIIDRQGLADLMPQRTARLALARNVLLDRSRAYASAYTIWADLDGVIDADYPSEEGFLSSFRLDNCWDAVFPVNDGIYYDVYALRHPVICPDDYTTLGRKLDASLGLKLGVHFAASHIQIDLRELAGWLPVDSAFGGMGIYKSPAFQGTRYVGTCDAQETCEHVSVHRQMRDQGLRLYLNPQFIVRSHGKPGPQPE